jgi:amino-acid N-acetyltransferase
MNIQPATPVDLPAIQALLTQAQLPADDLNSHSLQSFLVLRMNGALSGAVGLERYGTTALLRSLVVMDALRGRHFGGALTDAVEKLAQRWDVTSLYLLTTSADAFFAARGYQRIERNEAPEVIRGTTQFSALCPATAVLMWKQLPTRNSSAQR